MDSIEVVAAGGSKAVNINANGFTENALTMTGNAKVNTLTGTIFGDVLIGAGGIDNLNGGAGNDTFRYNALSEYVTGTTPPVPAKSSTAVPTWTLCCTWAARAHLRSMRT
ncbi:MAG: hypothetical protein EXR86_08765 [Gammaproteobacteria bacterium]|nr:hypothetical protein [Gammaproteobacteria bacterium]